VFGTPLGAHVSFDPVFLVLLAALAVVVWYSVRLMKEVPGFVRLLPYGSLLGAAVIPLAAGIYLLTTTAWGDCGTGISARSNPTGFTGVDAVADRERKGTRCEDFWSR
jgi:hypothetical protein